MNADSAFLGAFGSLFLRFRILSFLALACESRCFRTSSGTWWGRGLRGRLSSSLNPLPSLRPKLTLPGTDAPPPTRHPAPPPRQPKWRRRAGRSLGCADVRGRRCAPWPRIRLSASRRSPCPSRLRPRTSYGPLPRPRLVRPRNRSHHRRHSSPYHRRWNQQLCTDPRYPHAATPAVRCDQQRQAGQVDDPSRQTERPQPSHRMHAGRLAQLSAFSLSPASTPVPAAAVAQVSVQGARNTRSSGFGFGAAPSERAFHLVPISLEISVICHRPIHAPRSPVRGAQECSRRDSGAPGRDRQWQGKQTERSGFAFEICGRMWLAKYMYADIARFGAWIACATPLPVTSRPCSVRCCGFGAAAPARTFAWTPAIRARQTRGEGHTHRICISFDCFFASTQAELLHAAQGDTGPRGHCCGVPRRAPHGPGGSDRKRQRGERDDNEGDRCALHFR